LYPEKTGSRSLYLDLYHLFFFFHSLVFSFPLSAALDPSPISVLLLKKLYLLHIFYTVALHENSIMKCAV